MVNPGMSGRVVVDFIIGTSGSVVSASASSNDVPANVSACIARSFEALSFPMPDDGGTIHVTYPLVLSTQ